MDENMQIILYSVIKPENANCQLEAGKARLTGKEVGNEQKQLCNSSDALNMESTSFT